MDIWDIYSWGAAATVVGLLIWGMKLIFHDKLDARWHYFIWLVLGVRLLVPADLSWVRTPVSILQAIPVTRWVKMASLAVGDLWPEGASRWLLAGYLAGVAALGAYYLILWLAVCIRVYRAPKAPRELAVQVEAIAAKRGLASCKDIRVLPGRTPYIFGLLHPVLVLPGDWEQLEESVILHELLHRKYRDVAVNLLLHIVRVLNWYNPFLWMITSVIQNDGEALCDERVLELLIHGKDILQGGRDFAGQDPGAESNAKTDGPAGVEVRNRAEEIAYGYGRTLLSLAADKKGQPVKIGTSNLASTYRNMRTRLLRIREFDRVPTKIGVVTCCITLLLALSGIGNVEEGNLALPMIRSGRDLDLALLQARCYEAATPQEAVYLFLRTLQEGNVIYHMAVLPEGQIAVYGDHVRAWYREGCLDEAGRLSGEGGDIFAGMRADIQGFGIYNLWQDGERGGAEVCIRMRRGWDPGVPDAGGEACVGRTPGSQGLDTSGHREGSAGGDGAGRKEGSRAPEDCLIVELDLVKEEGWKVIPRELDTGNQESYRPPALVESRAQTGDFLVEMVGYQEGYFDSLGVSDRGMHTLSWTGSGQQESWQERYPKDFSVEYQMKEVWVTCLQKEALEGAGQVRLEVYSCLENAKGDLPMEGSTSEGYWPTQEKLARLSGDPYVASYTGSGGSDSAGNGYVVLTGEALEIFRAGEPVLVFGGSVWQEGKENGWKPGMEPEGYIRILADGAVVAEGYTGKASIEESSAGEGHAGKAGIEEGYAGEGHTGKASAGESGSQ